MTSSLVVLVGMLASVSACGQLHLSSFYDNSFVDTPPAYIPGQWLNTPMMANIDVTPGFSFDAFGFTFQDFRVFDTGMVQPYSAFAVPTGIAPDLSSFVAGHGINQLRFSPHPYVASYFTDPAATKKFEVKCIKRADQFDGSGVMTGAHICELEQAGADISAWSGTFPELVVDYMCIVTWDLKNGQGNICRLRLSAPIELPLIRIVFSQGQMYCCRGVVGTDVFTRILVLVRIGSRDTDYAADACTADSATTCANMSSSLLIVLGLVTSSLACQHLHLIGLRDNFWQNGGDSWYIKGAVDPDATTIGDTATVTTMNDFELFGETGNTFTISDQGALYWGSPTPGATDFSSYTGGDLANLGALAPAWFPLADLDEAQFEYKVLLRSDQWDAVSGDPIGAYVCLFETIEETIKDFSGVDEQVKETIMATWKLTDGTIMYTQLIVALTESGTTYAVMTYENLIGSTYIRYIVNGQYTTATGSFATVCGSGTDLDIDLKSNLRCGKQGFVVFSLAAAETCPSDLDCANLDPDWDSREKNCNELIEPTDTCDVEGFCKYISDTQFNFKYTFKSTVLHPDFDTFALVGQDLNLKQAWCVVAPSDVSAGTYTITHDFNIDGSSVFSQCDQVYDISTGIYTFLIKVWDSAEAVATPTPGYKAEDVYKQGSKFFRVKCRPSDLPTAASVAFTRPDGVATTSAPIVTGRTCTLEVANVYDFTLPEHKVFSAGTTVDLGTPLFLYACYNPGNPFYENASPYGIYVKSCKVGNTATFDDKYRNIIVDGCPTSATPGFKVLSQFVSFASVVDGTKFCISSGAMRAARWIAMSDIYFQCTFDFCRTTSFFASSKCAKSCDGTGVDQARKRREVGSESVTVTAHIQVSDKAVHESSKSCANETLAYAGIGALLVCLIVAIAAAVFLFLKLMSRKRKM